MPRLPSVISSPTLAQTSGRIRMPVGSVLTRSAQPLEQTLDRSGNQIQQNTARSTSVARANPLANANLIRGLSFTSGVAQTVNTALSGPLAGVVVSNPRTVTAGYPILVNNSSLTQATGTALLYPFGTFVCDVLVWQ